MDIMSGTPYPSVALSFDDDAYTLMIIATLNGIHELMTHFFAKTIEVLAVLHLNIAYPVFYNSIYQHVFTIC